jgi:hypothetical protein
VAWKGLLSRLKRNSYRLQEHGQHFVVTREKAEFNELRLAKIRAQLVPGAVGDAPRSVELVGCPKQESIQWGPSLRRWSRQYTVERALIDAKWGAQLYMLRPLIVVAHI